MEHFTFYPALSGGILIGLAAALLLLCNGRIAGISGISQIYTNLANTSRSGCWHRVVSWWVLALVWAMVAQADTQFAA
jgi:uncharacterized protein